MLAAVGRPAFDPSLLSRICLAAATAGLVAAAAAPAAAGLAGDGAPRQLFAFRDDRIAESSGLATDPLGETVFTIEDAGSAPLIWGVDLHGRTRIREQVVGTDNVDWEDLALGTDDSGDPALFVADTGDGYFRTQPSTAPLRTTFRVVRISLPVPSPNGVERTPRARNPVFWDFVYPDHRNHNSEALLVEPGSNRIFVIDKPASTNTTTILWRAPDTPSAKAENVLAPVTEVPVSLATGAAFSPDGHRFVVRNAQFAYVWAKVQGGIAASLKTAPRIIALPRQRQGEGVAFTADGNGLLLSSEGPRTPVWLVPLEPLATAGSTGANGPEQAQDAEPEPWQSVPLVTGTAVGVVIVVILTMLGRRRRRRAAFRAPSPYETDARHTPLHVTTVDDLSS